MEYVVTRAGPQGFQVSAVGEGIDGLVADFVSQAETEEFAASMRRLDAGRTHSMDRKEQGRGGRVAGHRPRTERAHPAAPCAVAGAGGAGVAGPYIP